MKNILEKLKTAKDMFLAYCIKTKSLNQDKQKLCEAF